MERKTRTEDEVKLLSRGSHGNYRHGIEINQRDITIVIHTCTCKHRLFCIFFRSDEAVDESLSTTLPSSEVKIRTKRDISLTIRLLQDSTSNLQNRSLCPWTYRIQTDSNRQPADLAEAVCSTSSVLLS